jgi:threonine synthase
MGLIDRIPAIGGIQASGCSPMVKAWQEDKEIADPVVTPCTHIATLATGDPGRTYPLLYQRMHMAYESRKAPRTAGNDGRDRAAGSSAGLFESVTDEETFRTMHILARLEGISVEPAAAVAFAGLIKLVRAGVIRPEEVIVINCTGHTMPIEPTILGSGWSRDICAPEMHAVAVPGSLPQSSSEQEGLLAALSRVTDDRFSKVLIVDDTEEARRLIRRILQSQGSYSIVEAKDGMQAIRMADQDPPDLIILDLMMPELDGFATLDRLKANPATAAVPVIVVTAKALTSAEKHRLEGRIHSLMQKGEFMSDELLEEVQALLL